MLPLDQLRQRFAEAGITFDRPIITTCGSGTTACALALGLELLGVRDVAVYDGSWSEWGREGKVRVTNDDRRMTIAVHYSIVNRHSVTQSPSLVAHTP
jgi:3-mercaptopyruvate sulfurtransferase SseA